MRTKKKTLEQKKTETARNPRSQSVGKSVFIFKHRPIDYFSLSPTLVTDGCSSG